MVPDPIVVLTSDLSAEVGALAAVLATLSADEWELATPSPRWSVRDQIGHLAFFDREALVAMEDPDAFDAHRDALFAAGLAGETQMDDLVLGRFRAMDHQELLTTWLDGAKAVRRGARGVEPGSRIPWYGPAMSVRAFLTARLMETWAHGTDVVDTVAAARDVDPLSLRPPTDRLHHICELGWRTRGWSYANRGDAAPDTPVALRLVAPSGTEWQWGDDDAAERIEGSAHDFALVVTQRRHVDDTGLVVTGAAARDWLERAQAFAGPATDGPAPGTAPQR